jgi:hypothetical protein
MIFECLECGTLFESDYLSPDCPNEETGLESHAVRPIDPAAPSPGRRRRLFRRR